MGALYAGQYNAAVNIMNAHVAGQPVDLSGLSKAEVRSWPPSNTAHRHLAPSLHALAGRVRMLIERASMPLRSPSISVHCLL